MLAVHKQHVATRVEVQRVPLLTFVSHFRKSNYAFQQKFKRNIYDYMPSIFNSNYFIGYGVKLSNQPIPSYTIEYKLYTSRILLFLIP